MKLTTGKLIYKNNQEYSINIKNPKTIEGGEYFKQISNKTLPYSGESPSFDFLSMPVYNSNGTKINTLNITHGYPQQGVLHESSGYYYTYIGFGETSDNAYIKISGVTIPYNRMLGRMIKWKTTINGSFEYVGQVILLGFSHQNISILNDNVFLTGTNGYNITSNNALDTYKDLRCFLIPLSEFSFSKSITDANVYATPSVGSKLGTSYKGKTISTNYMFSKSPDYDNNGDPTNVPTGTGAQWLYGLVDSSHIFTSNGNNLYVYDADLTNLSFGEPVYSLSNELNLGNRDQIYSTDKMRITSSPANTGSNITFKQINDLYLIKGRHIQSMTVRNNHLYITLGGANFAHSIEGVMSVKVVDLETGMLIGELDVESIMSQYGTPIPANYALYTGKDDEGSTYRTITNGQNMLIQELEDIYVSEDETYLIIAYVVSNPKYYKLDIEKIML